MKFFSFVVLIGILRTSIGRNVLVHLDHEQQSNKLSGKMILENKVKIWNYSKKFCGALHKI